LEGRLRVKSASVKGSPPKAQEVETHFRGYEGITEVVANPVTGSILFHYDSRRVDQNEILERLHILGWLSKDAATQKPPTFQPVQVILKIPEEFGQKLVKTVVTSTVEVALQRLVYALI
jgi:copper chaperone CopZ